MEDKLLFFSTFLKSPKQIGSVTPSSRFLIKELLKNVDFAKARYIVEYGPGIGNITKQLLKHAKKDSKIICFEVNKKFCEYLKNNIRDKRLIIINDSAENINMRVRELGIEEIDYVISGLPFSALPKSIKNTIILETRNSLRHNGKFVIYQFLNSFKKHLDEYFSNISTKFVALNIPPCFVYVCEK